MYVHTYHVFIPYHTYIPYMHILFLNFITYGHRYITSSNMKKIYYEACMYVMYVVYVCNVCMYVCM